MYLDEYKGEQDLARWNYRSRPPLAFPRRDLSLSGGGRRSEAFGACKNGVRERELTNRYFVMPKCSELSEGVFILQVEIQPLPLATSAF